MELEMALQTTGNILRSWANIQERPQLAEAFIDVLDLASTDDRLAVMKMVVTNFDAHKPQSSGNHQFSSGWSDQRWLSANKGVREFKLQLRKLMLKYRGHIDTITAAILTKMYATETTHDMRVGILSDILFSPDLCPHNYFRADIEVSQEEFLGLRENPKVTEHFQAFLTDKVRFVTSIDRAAYFMKMMDGRSEKERLIIFDIALRVYNAKENATSEPNPVEELVALSMLRKVIQDLAGSDGIGEHFKRSRNAQNN
jgi:hypothetical protein